MRERRWHMRGALGVLVVPERYARCARRFRPIFVRLSQPSRSIKPNSFCTVSVPVFSTFQNGMTHRNGSAASAASAPTLAKTPESSAPRPFIGYISGQWHPRQPQSPEQLAAIRWCRYHDYRTTESGFEVLRSTDDKNSKKRGNRVLRGRTSAM